MEAMETKQQTLSVIARLMGLDDSRHQQPIHKHHRVLSEDYLRKSASIGLQLKQSYYRGQSFRTSRLKLPEFMDVFEGREQLIQCLQSYSKKKGSLWAAKGTTRFEKKNSKDARCVELDERILNSSKCSDMLENRRSDKEIFMKYLQKLDSSGPNHLHDHQYKHSPFSQSSACKSSRDPYYKKNEKCWKPEKSIVRRNVLRSPQKLHHGSDTLEDVHSLQGISKAQVKLKSRIPVNGEARGSGNVKINLELCEDNFTTFRKTINNNELSSISTKLSVSEFQSDDNCVNEAKAVTPSSFFNLKNQEQASQPYSDQSSFTREAGNSDVQKMANKVQTRTSTKFLTICEMLHSSDERRPEKTYKLNKSGVCSKFRQNTVKPKLSRPLSLKSKDSMKNDVVAKSTSTRYNPTYKLGVSSDSSSSMNADVVEEITAAATDNVGVNFSDKELNAQQSETTDEQFMVKGGISLSEVSHTEFNQESPIESPEVGLIFSNCFEIEPELTSSWRDTHQPSPNSVLDPPYEEEILSDIECFESAGPASANLIGLWKQLQLLKSDIEDTLSEGPGMMVSSDEGTKDVSDDFSRRNVKSGGVFRAKETRDFSYLVDVLDEAGFYDTNWEVNVDKWHSPKCAVNPSVFEALEKKYGDQISWQMSERRLLFDRINSGLIEILHPCLDIPEWANPLSVWLGTRPRRDVIEEKLWNLLLSQEKEVNKGLSEKAVGGDIWWLKPGEDIDIIVSEIENFLYNDLAAELGKI